MIEADDIQRWRELADQLGLPPEPAAEARSQPAPLPHDVEAAAPPRAVDKIVEGPVQASVGDFAESRGVEESEGRNAEGGQSESFRGADDRPHGRGRRRGGRGRGGRSREDRGAPAQSAAEAAPMEEESADLGTHAQELT